MRIWERKFHLSGHMAGARSAYYPIFGLLRSDSGLVHKIIQHGNLLNPVLVETAEEGGVFVHPLLLEGGEGDAVYRKALRDRRNLLGMLLVCTLAACLSLFVIEEPKQIVFTLLAVLATAILYASADYRQVFKYRERLAERCMYYGWLFTSSRLYIFGLLSLFLVNGLFQFGLSDDGFLERFGMIYHTALIEPWRIVTGSLIHSGFAHWLTNLIIGVVIVSFCGPSQRHFAFPVFLLGGIISFSMTLAWVLYVVPSQADGLVGSSGGLSALLGSQLVLMTRHHRSYPDRFVWTVFYFVAVTMIAGGGFVDTVSLTCHVFGLLAGAMMGLVVPDYLSVNENATPEGGV